MPSKSIVKVPAKTSSFSTALESITLNSIRRVLPDTTIHDACHLFNYNYRNRFITPVVTVLHMVIAAIWPEESFNAARDMDLVVRGLFGEGTEAVGDFFQLSNQTTLGVSEESIVNQFTESIVPKIAEYESLARAELLENNANAIDDKIQRALGVLRSARLVSSQEALFLLSQIRMGVNLGRVSDISIRTINELFMLTQPAHLQFNSGEPMNPDKRDATRAEIIRSKLSQN